MTRGGAEARIDLADRIYELHRIRRSARVPVSRPALQERLECSRATVARVVRKLRDYLGAPVEFDRRGGGYRYGPTDDGPWELPGLWFNASELHALLAAHQLLANAQPGLLEADLLRTDPPRRAPAGVRRRGRDRRGAAGRRRSSARRTRSISTPTTRSSFAKPTRRAPS